MSLPDGTTAPVVDMTARRARILGPIQLVRKHSTATGSARSVLNVLASYADADSLIARPGRITLERDTGLSRSTLRRAVRRLEEIGEVVVVEEGHGGRATRYRIALSPAVDNPVEIERTQPGRGFTVNPGGVHGEPGGGFTVTPDRVLTGIDRGEGASTDPRTCAQHAGVENPPPCRRCRTAREAHDAAELAAAASRRDEARRSAKDRLAAEEAARKAARTAEPPAEYLAARRRPKT